MGKEKKSVAKGKAPAVGKGKKAAGRKKPAAVRAKRPRPWTHVHLYVMFLGIGAALTIFIGLTLYLFILLDIPNLQSIRDYVPKQTTHILDRDHQVVKKIFVENRRVVTMQTMPDLLPKAFVAAEDARFYEHPGVDFWSIFRALFHNLRRGYRAQGGSTITQQVTRSLLLSRRKVYSRKIKEAILAYRIDSAMSKDDILYIYLNQIYLGEGAYGVEAAAQTYFNKSVGDLSLAQFTLLAGLPQAPSRYSPFKDLKGARRRQAYVLNRMAEEGYISDKAARQAFEDHLHLNSFQESPAGGEYYLQQVSNYITTKYGREKLLTGGLTVYTFLDPIIQKRARAAIGRGLVSHAGKPQNNKTPQAAMVVMETGTGKVRATVGGVDFSASQFDRAVQARRQPGSAFKPVVYAAALEKGFTPDSILTDEPLRLAGASRGKSWQPKNFDHVYLGPITLTTGLVRSRNTIAIKLLRETGIKKVVRMAESLGISSKLKPDLTLALGSSGVSLLEMTAAYSAFANHGIYSEPVFIEKILDRNGNVIEKKSSEKIRAMSEKTADQVDRMLQEVISRGTGRGARGLKTIAAGKTGTTDNNMDAWFIGYTGDILAGVWVGYDRRISLGEHGSGGQIAAPIWLDFMKQGETAE